MDLPDSDRRDSSCRRAVDSSSLDNDDNFYATVITGVKQCTFH